MVKNQKIEAGNIQKRDLSFPENPDFKKGFRESVIGHLRAEYGKQMDEATEQEFWTALSRAVMELIAVRWEKSRKTYRRVRQAHYFSAEFLIGRSLHNNLVNLGIVKEAEELCAELGFELSRIEEEEIDPGLGNGGLGRLAACFMDSCATQNLPVTGYGILYRYGLFKQKIEDGFQKEYPDAWMELPYPFNCRRENNKVLLHYQDMDVWAVPYDLPITGYGTENINVLRLWRPEPAEEFDFNLFNSQRFDDALVERNRVQDIYRVLYPNDTSYDGKVLRVRQQYFFVAASLQSILANFVKEHGENWDQFAEFNVLHLNDTHPVLAIPELIRLLMDEHGLNFEKAFAIAQRCFAYTNHTVMAEALEKWDVSIFQFLFPRILEIVRMIDHKFREEARSKGLHYERIEANSPLHDGKVHMANLASYTSFSINGVAAIHSGILQRETLKDFCMMWPERFNNKTNGVTPRRWLKCSNPDLSELLTELLGSEAWVTDLSRLSELKKYADDQNVLQRFLEIKKKNKERLAQLVQKNTAVELSSEAIFDVQVKRLHEYKRQSLNALQILDLYYQIKDGKNPLKRPVNFIFGAKAAPGYFRAKSIIKFINEIARIIAADPQVSPWIKVIFLPNYNVSMGERIFPAADISEQISTVGKEASGTGNMKFMMNGALTLGTWDGANLEICDAVGEENAFMFGSRIKDFPATLDYYNSRWQYENIPGLKRVVDSLIDGTLNDNGTGMFQDLYRMLLTGSSYEKADIYYILGDFDEYRKRRLDVFEAYEDREKWAAMCWNNICSSGHFSSDRTISEYAGEIWKVSPQTV